MSLYADLHSTLRNTALGFAFNPPEGKHWTREMFMPGYSGESGPTVEYDWQGEKAKMALVGQRQDPVKRRQASAAAAEALASTRDRFRQVAEAKKRGTTRQEIQLLMEA